MYFSVGDNKSFSIVFISGNLSARHCLSLLCHGAIFYFQRHHGCESVKNVRNVHPEVVLLPVLSPVVSRVTEHQHVTGQPVGAAVASLCGYGGDLGPPGQVHLQPLVPVWNKRRPASSSCTGDRVGLKSRKMFYSSTPLRNESKSIQSLQVKCDS